MVVQTRFIHVRRDAVGSSRITLLSPLLALRRQGVREIAMFCELIALCIQGSFQNWLVMDD